MRVSGFEVDDDRVRLQLAGGGWMVIPLDRVDRIVDDEFDPDDFRPPAPPGKAAAAPLPSLRLAASSSRHLEKPFGAIVEAAAKASRLDPALVAAVIAAESAFQPRAVSRKGARGLMQLMPATARRLGVRRPFDPAENVRGGAAYLSELAERYGDRSVELVLAAYNAGEGAVDEYKGVPPYRETREYVRRVLAFWHALRGEVADASSRGAAPQGGLNGPAGASPDTPAHAG